MKYSEATINKILDELEFKRILEDISDNNLIDCLRPEYKRYLDEQLY